MEWPPESLGNTSEPFTVGIVGEDPFGSYLDQVVSGEKAMGRPIIIKRNIQPDQISQCQVLFINSPGSTNNILAALKGKSILTVSDEPRFCIDGGMIRFYTENDMVRLQINTNAAKAANLLVSSKLLRIAKIYD
jgi:hypothetical protein